MVKEIKEVREEDSSEDIEKYCQEILEKNKEAVKNYKEGGKDALDFLASEVLRKVKRKTNVEQDEQNIKDPDKPKEKEIEEEKQKEIEPVLKVPKDTQKSFIEVLEENPQAVENYKKGDLEALNFLADKVEQKTGVKEKDKQETENIKVTSKPDFKKWKRNILHFIGAYKTSSEIKAHEKSKKEETRKVNKKKRLHSLDIARKVRQQKQRKIRIREQLEELKQDIKKTPKRILHSVHLYKTPTEIKNEQEFMQEKERLLKHNLLRKQKDVQNIKKKAIREKQQEEKQKVEEKKKEEADKQKQLRQKIKTKEELKRKNKELMQNRINMFKEKTFDFLNKVGLLKTADEKQELLRQKQEYYKYRGLVKEEAEKRKFEKKRGKELKKIKEEQKEKENIQKKKKIVEEKRKQNDIEKRRKELRKKKTEDENKRLETIKIKEKRKLKELELAEKKREKDKKAEEKQKRVKKFRKKIYDLLHKLIKIKSKKEKLTIEQIEAIEQKLEESHKFRTAEYFIKQLDKEGTIKLTKEQIESIEKKIERSKKYEDEHTRFGN